MKSISETTHGPIELNYEAEALHAAPHAKGATHPKAEAEAKGKTKSKSKSGVKAEAKTQASAATSTAPRGTTGKRMHEHPVHAFDPGTLDVHQVYQDGQVQVISDEPLTQAKAKALSTRIEKAYNFDKAQQKWGNEAPLNTPLTVAVLSRPSFSQLTGDSTGSIAGVTTGPNLFVVPDAVLGRKTALDEETIAHELGHVQDFRQAGPAITKVPIYLQEGKEYVLGENYPLAEKMKNPHIQYVGNALGQITGQDAQMVMKHFRTGQDEATSGSFGFIGETTGALFVEFLRTRLGGKGVGDAVPRVADVLAQVGQGQSYDAAFKSQFGVSATQAENEFVQYVRATEGNPQARLQGTLFAPPSSSPRA